ncbi:MAG: tyrosine-type recombinase/integrase, partial [Stomatobaculum sp.]|nr:tyrosine-type recombinase/integrase [Stomatobaculum sp.]
DEIGALILKTTKTAGSTRVIEYPDFVIEALKGVKGRFIQSSPDVLSNRFKRTVNRIGGPKFRFHDLRHYAASIMHAIGVPDQYIMSRGGWSSDVVMKRVYRNVIDIEAQKQTRRINNHFLKVSHV